MIITRRASRNNIPAIAELLTKAVTRKQGYGDNSWGTEAFSNDEVADMLDSSRVYIATIDGKVVGTVSISNKDRFWQKEAAAASAWYITRMASDESAKGQDVGGELLRQLKEDAQRQNVEYLRLDCDSQNKGLGDYYKSKGFELVKQIELHNNVTGDTDHKDLYQLKV